MRIIALFLCVMVANLLICGCSSEEPDGTRSDKVENDTTSNVSDSLILWEDTVSPVYVDEYVPYKGSVTPLNDSQHPIFTQGKKWLVWRLHISNPIGSSVSPGNSSDNYLFEYGGMETDSDGNINALVMLGEYVDCRFKEVGSSVWVYNKYTRYKRDEAGNSILEDYWEYEYSYDSYFDPASQQIPFSEIRAESRGTIVFQGKTRRATKLIKDTNGQCEFVDYWVEGIGPLFGFAMKVNKAKPMSVKFVYKLLECWDGDEKIYDMREFNHDLYTPIDKF